MKDLSSLMKQAQAMQEKLGAAQAEIEQLITRARARTPLGKLGGQPLFGPARWLRRKVASSRAFMAIRRRA